MPGSMRLPRVLRHRPHGASTLLARVLGALFFACFLVLGGCSSYVDPVLQTEGGCPPSSSSFLPATPSLEGRISYCEGGDGWIGSITSGFYPAGTQRIELMLTGYPANPGMSLSAISPEGREVPLTTSSNPAEHWERKAFDIPPAVSLTGFRIRLQDQTSSTFGWAGMGASTSSPAIASIAGAWPILLGVLVGNVWLVALSLAMPVRGTPSERVMLGLLVGGCVWFLVFCAYVVSVQAGTIVALAALVLPLPFALMSRIGHKVSKEDVTGVQRILLPGVLLASFVLWIGLFPFHWQGHGWDEPAKRWFPLAMDGWLPLMFGDMLANGHVVSPMAGDWLSSDRPPLQAGLYLMIRELLPESRGLLYQGIATWAQTLVLVPLGCLLTLISDRRSRAIALFTLCLSALVLLNTLMVWPKLLSAAFCLIYYMALFPGRGTPTRWGRAGVAAALALLSHGGALFFLAGTSLLHLAWYRRRSVSMLLRTGALSALIYLPWIAYQRLIDPPGNRLIKWHFAGKIPVSDEGTMQALTSAYGQLTPSTWLLARLENVKEITAGAFTAHYQSLQVIFGGDPSARSHFVEESFFHTFHAMWFTSPLLLLPCIALMIWRKRRQRQPDSIHKPLFQALTTATITFLICAILLFQGGSANIHQGSYAAVVLLQFSILLATWKAMRPLFYAACAANVTTALSIYALDRTFLPGLQLAYVGGTLLLAGALLAASFVSTRSVDSTSCPDPQA